MTQVKQFYEFGEFRLDLTNKVLRRGGENLQITRKMFDTLCVLVENADRLVEKDELMRRIWHDRFVEESNLTYNIKMLRKTLGDSASQPKFIETVPRRGYRFIAEVRLVEEKVGIEKIVLEEIEKVVLEKAEAQATPPLAPIQKKRRKYLAVAVGGILLLSILGFAYYYNKFPKNSARSFQQINTARITSTGKAFYSIISPDGKYVIHARDEGEKQSLWIRQSGETRDIEIVPPTSGKIGGLSVSPDSKSVYYTLWQENQPDAVLYQVPILGGASRQVISNVDSGISFSAGGGEFAFYRTDQTEGLSQLLVANLDGTHQRVIAERRSPETFETEFGDPVWKPNERKILAIAASNAFQGKSDVVEIDIETGAVKTFVESRWKEIHQIAWLKNSQSLLLIAFDEESNSRQIWHVEPKAGIYRKITGDVNNYRGISLNDDEKTLITTQITHVTRLWKTTDKTAAAEEILSETGNIKGDEGLAWTPDNHLVFSLGAHNADNIMIFDRSGIRPLTVDANGNRQPTVCGENQIVYAANFASSEPNALRLWKMDRDGKNPQRLTADENESEMYPHCSASSSSSSDWVVFQKGSEKPTLWKIPISGGKSVQLTKTLSFQPTVSPDGRMVAYYSSDNYKWSISVASTEDGKLLKQFPISPASKLRHLRWTPDGKNLAFSDSRRAVSNIWLHPLDGSSPIQLTNFDSETIFYFDWSADGANLAYARGTTSSDVFSISDVN
ncbi:MAG TPA: winged helix-turn-helix domain-containing protein [Pyrinomonadaceae bacterium]|jgi:DNA-binding winged helix-turn-helix (wHTH) protein/Tol biopolymer transport system component